MDRHRTDLRALHVPEGSMIEVIPIAERQARLEGAGLPNDEVFTFLQDLDALHLDDPGDRRAKVSRDAPRVSLVCRQGRALLERLPLKSKRTPQEKTAGHALVHLLADGAWHFFRLHRRALYDSLTKQRSQPLRVDELAWQAAELLPGILPTHAELAEESRHQQQDKDGLEIHQGLFFSQLLSDRDIGLHLCTSMLRPKPEAVERLAEFRRSGRIDLGQVRLEAKGATGYIYFHHPRYINAEDDDTVGPQETAADLILLHPDLRIGVIRGEPVDHPKYKAGASSPTGST
jgi:thioesterase DpgC